MHYVLTVANPEVTVFAKALAVLTEEIVGDQRETRLWFYAAASAEITGNPAAPLRVGGILPMPDF